MTDRSIPPQPNPLRPPIPRDASPPKQGSPQPSEQENMPIVGPPKRAE